MSELDVLVDGLGFPESPRWHDRRLWLCNWGPGEILAVASDGSAELILRLERPSMPLSIDWTADGQLLVVEGRARLLHRLAPDGELAVHANLTEFGEAPFNEIVVDATGNAYVNGGPGALVLIRADGAVVQVADGFQWPNGMVLIDAGHTLVVADSHLCQLVAYAVNPDGTLTDRRVWAELADAPDGICADAEGAIWVASVPGESMHSRARRGGDPRYGLRRPGLLRLHAGRHRSAHALHNRGGLARHGSGDARRAGHQWPAAGMPGPRGTARRSALSAAGVGASQLLACLHSDRRLLFA